jgi:putative hydrolase of the HAD superfamily
MKYEAVIFDLFGTLVRNFSTPEYQEVLEQMAASVSLPPGEFVRLWYAVSRERNTGGLESIKACIRHIGVILGKEPGDEQIKLAVKARLDYVRSMLAPRPQAEEVLVELKSKGYKVGLLSDCSVEIPMVFNETPLAPLFDATIFSCAVGVKKPDPKIYAIACAQLGVAPEKCLYIGDGGSRELTGASAAGMHAVMIAAYGKAELPQANSEAHEWQGQRISSLDEVLALLG